VKEGRKREGVKTFLVFESVVGSRLGERKVV
jgi:hypothetical protein